VNSKQENKLAMYLAVLAACETHLPTIRSMPAMSEAHAEFSRHVANIQRIAQVRDIDNTGLSTSKLTHRKAMAETASTLALAIRAYALKVRNHELAAMANVPATHMMRGRDLAATGIARNIHALAVEHQAALGPFGVTAEKVRQLDADIEAYAASIGRPRAAAVQGTTLTTQLAQEFESADTLLDEQMDGLMEQFRDSDPGLLESYGSARALVRLKGSRVKVTPLPAPVPAPRPQQG
jgi:hypothetical protein